MLGSPLFSQALLLYRARLAEPGEEGWTQSNPDMLGFPSFYAGGLIDHTKRDGNNAIVTYQYWGFHFFRGRFG